MVISATHGDVIALAGSSIKLSDDLRFSRRQAALRIFESADHALAAALADINWVAEGIELDLRDDAFFILGGLTQLLRLVFES